MECAITILAVMAIITVIAAIAIGLRILLGWGIAEMIDSWIRK